MDTPWLEELLGCEWQLRHRATNDYIGFVVKKSPQDQKNRCSNGRREAFGRKLLRKFPIGIILGNSESHLQILLDKRVERGIISNAEVRLCEF